MIIMSHRRLSHSWILTRGKFSLLRSGFAMWGMRSSREWTMTGYTSIRCRPDQSWKGKKIPGTCPQKQYTDEHGRLIDASFMEIGHLVKLLISGNVNAIWRSPARWSSPTLPGARDRLRKVVVSTLPGRVIIPIGVWRSPRHRTPSGNRVGENPEKPFLTAIPHPPVRTTASWRRGP